MLDIDAAVRLWLASHHTPILDALMMAVSAAGRGGLVWLALGVGLAFRRPAAAAGVWRMALAILLASQLTDLVLKPAVARGRPFTAITDVRVVGEPPDTYSFPSGHAANAFAGALALARVWRRARVAIWILAATVAFSRVYLGVHYPLDVLGGAALGLAVSWFVLGGRPVASGAAPVRAPS